MGAKLKRREIGTSTLLPLARECSRTGPSATPSLSPLQGIFLVYDISSERSYQHIMKWVSDVDEVGEATSEAGGEVALEREAKGGPCEKDRGRRG